MLNSIKRGFCSKNPVVGRRPPPGLKRKRMRKNPISIFEKEYTFEMEQKHIFMMPIHDQEIYKSKENMAYGSALRFFMGRNDQESCKDLIDMYTQKLPRALVLPEWSYLDSKKLKYQE